MSLGRAQDKTYQKETFKPLMYLCTKYICILCSMYTSKTVKLPLFVQLKAGEGGNCSHSKR